MNAESTIHHNVTREFRHGTRGESAARCIGPITKGCEIFGLTKAAFTDFDIGDNVKSQQPQQRLSGWE